MEAGDAEASPSVPSTLTARAARWSAHHRRVAIFGWLGVVVAATVIGGSLGTKTIQNNQQGVGESGHAQNLINDAFPTAADETILVQSKAVLATSPRFRAVVADEISQLRKVDGVIRIQPPYATKQISADGRSALINFQLRGGDTKSQDESGKTLAV